jgi:hypothetical protein
MSARPRPMQSECLDEDPVSIKASAEVPAIRLADLKNDEFPSWRPSLGDLDPLGRLGRLDPLAFARYLITFSIGVAVALAWQSYGNATREGASFKALSLDRDAVRQSLDHIATSVATAQEQMTQRIERSIERLAAGQEQTTRQINDVQTFEQYVLDRISTLPPRSAPTTVSKPVQRPPQVPMARSDIP